MTDINPLCPGHDASDFDRFARLALDGVVREYPNQPGYRLASADDLVPPSRAHPAFYGCYDWHSAVHGHWLLVRLLRGGRLSPTLAGEAERVVRDHLTPEHVAAERGYFARPDCAGFEWPYGWAWLLALYAETRRWDHEVAAALAPLADDLARRTPRMLERMRTPQRTGQHGDTAFALQLMLEAGVEPGLADAIGATALRWYSDDTDYPWRYEQGPYDFHSPGLSEIGLMRHVLSARTPSAFDAWLYAFWPGLIEQDFDLGALAEPAACPDDSDGKLAHLHGLNLERARILSGLLSRWDVGSPTHTTIGSATQRHAAAGLAGVHSGDYAGEHWLATFAVRLLLGAGASV